MRRLIKLHVIRAGHDLHDHATVLAFLDSFSELRAFRRNSFTVTSMSSHMIAIECCRG